MSLQPTRRDRVKTLVPWVNSSARFDETLILVGVTTAFVFALAIVFGFIAG